MNHSFKKKISGNGGGFIDIYIFKYTYFQKVFKQQHKIMKT